MLLSSQPSQFVFNLPSDLIPENLKSKYDIIMEKNFVWYDDVLDYLNSTIKGINFGGFSLSTDTQVRKFGKIVDYKPVTNINDTFDRVGNITFRAVDGDTNYWMMLEIATNTYMNTEQTHLSPFTLTTLDYRRDAIYQVKFSDIIISDVSDIDFNYSSQDVIEKTFTVTIKFVHIEIDFLLNQEKILVTDPDGTSSIQYRDLSGLLNPVRR